jgi:Flp pilus assembly protein TadD
VKPAAGEVKADEAKGEAKADQKPGDPVPAAAAVAAVSESGKTAAQEKHDCQVALERSSFKKSAEAGERSVGLDPTDAEAWLLLGAAYQSMGNGTEARRAFNSCLKEGKRGPLGECRAMLR